MKIIIVGDVHGTDFWKLVREKESDFDKFIFIGDYFDSFDKDFKTTANNYLDILHFQEMHDPGKVITLLGNHDFHYTSFAGNDRYSGFDFLHSNEIWDLLSKPLSDKKLPICHSDNGVLFSHAGVSATWLHKAGFTPEEYTDTTNNELSEKINNLFFEKPELFRFSEEDKTGYGDHESQGPLWIRPDSLNEDEAGLFIQVVGHTRMKNIKQNEAETVAFIDAVASNEYLVINDGHIQIKKL